MVRHRARVKHTPRGPNLENIMSLLGIHGLGDQLMAFSLAVGSLGGGRESLDEDVREYLKSSAHLLLFPPWAIKHISIYIHKPFPRFCLLSKVVYLLRFRVTVHGITGTSQ